MYECCRCHYQSSNPCNMKIHLRRKKPCTPEYSDLSQADVLIKLFPPLQTDISCSHCNKCFQTRNGLLKHIRNKRCNQSDIIEEYNIHDETSSRQNETDTKIMALESRIKHLENQLHQQHCGNINNVSGSTINTNSHNSTVNIHINDFKYIDGEHVSGDTLIYLIEKIKTSDIYYDIFQKVLELIYFDKNHPEMHSLVLPNVKHNFCKIIHNGKPQFENKDTVTDLAINETKNTLHDKYDENPYQYSIITRQTMNKMNDKYDDNDKTHIKKLKNKTDISLMNSKKIVMDTWKTKGFS